MANKALKRVIRTLGTGLTRGPAADAWLIRNKLERMDANRADIFNASRADFHKDRYHFASAYVTDKCILDVACGTGYGSESLKRAGKAALVYGLDIDADTIKYACQTYGAPGLRFLEGSITDMPFRNGLFDVVVSFETLEHVDDEQAQLREVLRVLKPGGRYIVSTPNDWGITAKNPHHVRSYTLEALREALGQSFSIEEIYNQNSGTPGREANHEQPRGITKTTADNWKLAECYLAVASSPSI